MQPGLAVVGIARNKDTAVDLHNSRNPDITLLDLSIPDLDIVDTIKAIKAQQTDAPVLILTTSEDSDADIQPAIDAGAIRSLLKDTPPEELLHIIRTATTG